VNLSNTTIALLDLDGIAIDLRNRASDVRWWARRQRRDAEGRHFLLWRK
jgi:hypothetical protein